MSLSLNVASNFTGRMTAALLTLVFMPIQAHLLGLEAYSFVGLLALFQTIGGLLDFGLPVTINRLMAGEPNSEVRAKNLRGFEMLLWLMAIVIFLTGHFVAPLLANHWLKPVKLTLHEVITTLTALGLIVALRFPFGLYQNAILGMEKQARANIIVVISAALKTVGSVWYLKHAGATLENFFWWESWIAALETVAAFSCAWGGIGWKRCLHPHVSLEPLRTNARFAGGVFGINLTALALTYGDRVCLGTMLNLDDFGRYVLAGGLAAGMYNLVYPISQAMLPRLSSPEIRASAQARAAVVQWGTKLISLTIVPLAIIASLYPQDVFLIWTRDFNLSLACASIFSVLCLAVLADCMSNPAHVLQVAMGQTAQIVRFNVIAALLYAPLLWMAVHYFGLVGPAFVQICIRFAAVVFVSAPAIRRWTEMNPVLYYSRGFGIPIAIVATVSLLSHRLL